MTSQPLHDDRYPIMRHFAADDPTLTADRRMADVDGQLRPELQPMVRQFGDLAQQMTGAASGPEVAAGLRKLLEARDWFVRAQIGQPAT